MLDNLLAVRVIRSENSSPEFFRLTFNEISSLESEESVLIGNHDEFFVTLAPRALVGDDGQMRVTFFAELTNSLRIIELVIGEEVLRILVGVDLDLG